MRGFTSSSRRDPRACRTALLDASPKEGADGHPGPATAPQLGRTAAPRQKRGLRGGHGPGTQGAGAAWPGGSAHRLHGRPDRRPPEVASPVVPEKNHRGRRQHGTRTPGKVFVQERVAVTNVRAGRGRGEAHAHRALPAAGDAGGRAGRGQGLLQRRLYFPLGPPR